jgi:DNA-binding beta-propeller fold protein YncE
MVPMKKFPISRRVVALGWAALACLLVAACGPAVAPEPREVKLLLYPPPPDEPRFVYERTLMSSADVEELGSERSLRMMLTGETATAEGLGKPYSVAVHQGKVYVSDTVDRLVKVFDFPRRKFYKVGDDERNPLQKPLGIDVDQAGNLYAADASSKSVKVYDHQGKFLLAMGGPKFFDRLSSVTVTPDGSRVYVVDIGGVESEQHRVRVFDGRSGSHLYDIGKRGGELGEFNLPRDVAIGKDGRLYVVDGGNFRVQIFDRDGKPIKAFGKVGRQPGQFARPKEIATDSEGNVYVVDAAFGNFQIFSPDGELLMFIGNRNERGGPGEYLLPSGIAVDEDGRVYFVDQWFRKVDIFRPYALKENEGYLGRAVFTSAREKK